jgi:F-type H+-transporting ATPase subunit gamma
MIELKRKIRGIKSTQQITKAMKLIAGTRLAREQRHLSDVRYFAARLEELTLGMFRDYKTEEGTASMNRFFMRQPSNKIGLFVVTGEKGLCGSFNNNIINESLDFIKSDPDREVVLFVAGRKGKEHFQRIEIRISGEYVNIFSKLVFADAGRIADDLIKCYLRENLSGIVFIYNEFKSIIKQKIVKREILPFTKKLGEGQKVPGYIFEPEKNKLSESLLMTYIKSQTYLVLKESYTSELAARVNAMDNATRNAEELIEDFTLVMNKIRQAGITREIAEIVGTGEALR